MEGRTLSHYRVLERLGSGGMGVVYKAQDTLLDRFVALKFLPPALTTDDDARLRFVQEAKAASALDHPNVCTIHEIATTDDGQLFIAMAYYEGETLKQRIGRGRLGAEEALDIAIQAAQGLERAHQAGIVHRDIKPANLMITREGIVKILDFGIAKLTGPTELTATGVTSGTPSYMAPEQFRGAAATVQSDVWALGVVLYEMLTGAAPFRGGDAASVMHAVLNETPRAVGDAASDVPARLAGTVSRALAKKPEGRYRSVDEFRAELAACRQTMAEPSAPAGVGEILRRPRVAVPAALIVLGLALTALWSWNRASEVRWAREEAIPEILGLIERDELVAACALADGRSRRFRSGRATPTTGFLPTCIYRQTSSRRIRRSCIFPERMPSQTGRATLSAGCGGSYSNRSC